MKQIDKIINQCRRAINAGVPVLYIESDDIGIIDDILRAEKLTKFWYRDADDGWIQSSEVRPANVMVRNINMDMGFNWGIKAPGPKTNAYYGESKLILESSPNVLEGDYAPGRHFIAIRNYGVSRNNATVDAAEKFLVEHVAYVVSSNPDDDIRKCFIMLQSPYVNIPKGIESYVELIEVPKLEDEEIREIIIEFAEKRNEKPYDKLLNSLVVNLRGFNARKIREILSRIYLLCQGLFVIKCENEGIRLITEVKQQMLKKEGLLTWKSVDRRSRVCGLECLTEWLNDRVELFKDPIRAEAQWNLSVPKGILVSGIPGTGKSALANEIGTVLDLPIIQFDMGSILGKYSGESEANMRRAIKLAESMSPCVLWIDEIEKAFSAASASGDSDGGQGKRLFGQFLTWMQEKKEACFIFATANDISALPPEFLRRGRFDQKFYTFMPAMQDCVEIFKGIVKRLNGSANSFCRILDDNGLDGRLNGIMRFCGAHGKFVTGADIEGIVKDAMFSYYKKYQAAKNSSEPYDPEKFVEEIKGAILKVQTYGETDLAKIVDCLFSLAKNQFSSASSSNNIISLNDVNVRERTISEFKGVRNGYDELLHARIKAEVDYLKRLQERNSNSL